MDQVTDFLSQLAEHWRYFSIPFITALVGGATNWLAIKMTLYPVEYVGRRPFGWQGIVPSMAGKFGGVLADHSLIKIGGLDAINDALDYESIKKYVLEASDPLIDEFVNEVMREQNRVLWENLPGASKQAIYSMARLKLETKLDPMVDDLSSNITRLIDLRAFVVSRLEGNRGLINEVVLACAQPELRVLVNSGFIFGFIFGIVQAFVWTILPAWWVLPAFGILVGATTNWIAIQLIFRPLYRTKIGPFVLHGLFLKRQPEVSKEFAEVFTHKLLNVRELTREFLHGKRKDRTYAMVRKHLSEAIEEDILTQALTQITLGPERFANLKDIALAKAVEYTDELADDPAFNEQQARSIEGMLRDKLSSQPPEEFQNLVRPIFQKDEWILLAVGGALGGLAGWGQLVWLFGDQLLTAVQVN